MDLNEEDIEYDVAQIVNLRRRHRTVAYCIQWDGYTEEDDIWETIDKLSCPDKLREFHEKYPQKPRYMD